MLVEQEKNNPPLRRFLVNTASLKDIWKDISSVNNFFQIIHLPSGETLHSFQGWEEAQLTWGGHNPKIIVATYEDYAVTETGVLTGKITLNENGDVPKEIRQALVNSILKNGGCLFPW